MKILMRLKQNLFFPIINFFFFVVNFPHYFAFRTVNSARKIKGNFLEGSSEKVYLFEVFLELSIKLLAYILPFQG